MVGDHFEGFRSSYKWLIRLPRTSILLTAALILGATSLAFSWSMNLSLLDLIKSLILGLLPPAYLHLLGRKVFTFRRSLGLFLTFLVFLPISLLIGKTPIYATLFEFFLGFLLTIAVYSVYKGFVYFVLHLAPIHILGLDIKLHYGLAAFYAASLLTFIIIDGRIRKVAGVSGIGFLESFLRYVLSGEQADVEYYLERISTERTLPVHIYSFFSNGEELGRLVVSTIHPGPLRTLGSSTLPQLVRQCSRTPLLFLKAPCAHSENLPTVKAARRVAGTICNANTTPQSSRAIVGASDIDILGIIVLDFEGLPRLAFLDPRVIMEDLPHRVSELSLEELNTVTVDAHNMIAPGFLKIDNSQEDEVAKIIASLKTATENKIAEGRILAGFSNINYSDNITIGPAGITCAAMDIGGKRLLVVSFDGNNMELDFKARLLTRLNKIADAVLVATTDTHIYTGLYRGRDYYPVGWFNPEKVMERTLKCAEDALASMREASVGYWAIPVKDKFMDGEKLNRISTATRKNTRDGLFLVLLALAISLSLLLL